MLQCRKKIGVRPHTLVYLHTSLSFSVHEASTRLVTVSTSLRLICDSIYISLTRTLAKLCEIE